MNEAHIREVALHIGECVLGQGGRTRSDELAGIMLAFLTFARGCGLSDADIEIALDAGNETIKTLAPAYRGRGLRVVR